MGVTSDWGWPWSPSCWCATCDELLRPDDSYAHRMNVCPTCQSKWCACAQDHQNQCDRVTVDV